MGERYLESWDRALTATASAGGGIAHHHGAGRLRRDYLQTTWVRTTSRYCGNSNRPFPPAVPQPGNLHRPISGEST